MAGGSLTKGSKTQNKFFGLNVTNEILSDKQSDSRPAAKFSLRGVLGLGQTVEVNRSVNQISQWGKEVFGQISHLDREHQQLIDQKQQQLERAVSELQTEIAKLSEATENLDSSITNLALNPVTEISEYQLNFLDRVRGFIAKMRQNISSASLWLDAFAAKKKKRNYFWSMVNNKKKGGSQFLFSDESGLARAGS